MKKKILENSLENQEHFKLKKWSKKRSKGKKIQKHNAKTERKKKKEKKKGELCQLCTSNKLIRFLDIFLKYTVENKINHYVYGFKIWTNNFTGIP